MTTLVPLLHPRPAKATGRHTATLPEAQRSLRFTLDGGEALELHLTHLCSLAVAGVRAVVPDDSLQGLLLGGSYGRGEGGVLRTEQGEAPYNDMEFYVFIRGDPQSNARHYGKTLRELAEWIAPGTGVEIEFRILSLEQLSHSPITMPYYDLVTGHRQLWGRQALVADCEQHRMASRIPASEATRLLLNRCSGLLFAKERLRRAAFSAEDADFVGRNLAKARLALGDAVLTAYGLYNWSSRVRGERLHRLVADEPLPWLEEVRAHHEAGVGFKLHPRHVMISHAALDQQHAELAALSLKVWLWLESHRLDVPFRSAYDYATSPVDKCPETNHWHNWIINVRLAGTEALLDPARFRYPREHLFNALALLLWEQVEGGNGVLARVQRELHTQCRDFPGLVQAYDAAWRMFH